MDTLRLGVIGTGSVVREIYQYLYHRSRYTRLIRIDAICDTSDVELERVGQDWGIPASRRFTDYEQMLAEVELDAVAVNTPDNRHRHPVIAALKAGLDVMVPKPTSDTVTDAHAMIEAVRSTGRFLGVDFHKREDPVTKEIRARLAAGAYGTLQTASFEMLDKLLVADPNHDPRFFSSPDFAEQNSPVSFLTSHMADTFIFITGLRPLEVRSVGYRQKLPSLSPISVSGYDLVDTTILFERGVLCRIATGWALPNTADCLTVQSGRLIFTDGMVDLWDNHYGYREITAGGIDNRNVLFRNFTADGTVGGFGMDSPGRIIEHIVRHRHGEIRPDELDTLLSPYSLGLYTTLVCECAHASLAAGVHDHPGVVVGSPIDARQLLASRIGSAADTYYRGA